MLNSLSASRESTATGSSGRSKSNGSIVAKNANGVAKEDSIGEDSSDSWGSDGWGSDDFSDSETDQPAANPLDEINRQLRVKAEDTLGISLEKEADGIVDNIVRRLLEIGSACASMNDRTLLATGASASSPASPLEG